jgi:DNA ligase-1
MLFTDFAHYLSKLEKTSSRLQMTEILAKLFKQCEAKEIINTCYLSLGQLAPKYEGLEFNMAEKLIIRAIAKALNIEVKEVVANYKKSGDLGNTIEEFKSQKSKVKTKSDLVKNTTQNLKLSINEIYNILLEIAQEAGNGSVERKINKMSNLIQEIDPLSAKYIVRTTLEKLRLGFSDMTILDALSWMEKGDKSYRSQLERAFNILADIGRVAQIFKTNGIKGIKELQSEVGIPIRPAKAERLPNPEKILEKMKGQCALEPKYDGFRVQIHINKLKTPAFAKASAGKQNLNLFEDKDNKIFVRIFSRNLEDTTHMFPEIVAEAQNLPVKSVILDGEAIAYSPKTGKFLAFQETVQRKRKHNVSEKAKELPLKVFVFDILYLNGESLLDKPFKDRRQTLTRIIAKTKGIELTEQKVVTQTKEFASFFNQVVNEGLEGLMAKKLDSVYRPGARDFTWVKYKAGMTAELADTIDCVVMGYYRGKGKRSSFGVGAFLVGVVDKGQYLTVSKIGTGLTDEQWQELKTRCAKWQVEEKPKEYVVQKNLTPDVWVDPKVVVEIESDMVTKSPLHSAQWALRFPRLKRFRDDKNPDQSTSISELKKIANLS